MRKQWLVLLVAILASASLWGCGSGGSGGSAVTDTNNLGEDPSGNAYVSADTCIGCHETFSWSADEVSAFLEGPHVIHSDHITGASDEACLECHDPIGDGDGIASYIAAADVPADGLAAVGCENCHGGGGEHFGVGPIPSATPDATACQQCHDDQWSQPGNAGAGHFTYHPEGGNIYTDWAAGPHADADGRNEAICVKCHNDEGARKYKDVETVEALAVTLPIDGTVHAIQCRTCHDPHNPGELLKEAYDSGYPNHDPVASAEYATCTNCHQKHDAQLADTVVDGSTLGDASGDLIYHANRYNRVIANTHYDDPATTDLIEGYQVKAVDDRACRDCHNVHSADNTINEQWAMSGHGGEILTAKEDALAASGFGSHDGEAVVVYREAGAAAADSSWAHYDWDATTEYDATDGVVDDRGECQRCHTSTGYANYVTDPANYDQLNNDFSHLVGWSLDGGANGETVSSGQNEMLYCWACHSDNQGALRVTDAVTVNYDRVNVVTVNYPDIGASNSCVPCHAGRGVATPDPGTSSHGQNHHGVAAAVLFAETTHAGAEFDGQDYSPVSYFEHPILGTADDDATGNTDAGPCAVCHMNAAAAGDANHTFAVVDKDATTGVITGLNSEACVSCHSGAHGAALVTEDSALGTAADAAAFLEEEAEGYVNARELVEAYIANTVQNFADTAFDSNGLVDDAATTDDENLNSRRAFQNAELAANDVGGYAHNRYYVKRLLFDSIDYLDNQVLDGTINIDDTAYPEAAIWFGANTAEDVAADNTLVLGEADRP